MEAGRTDADEAARRCWQAAAAHLSDGDFTTASALYGAWRKYMGRRAEGGGLESPARRAGHTLGMGGVSASVCFGSD